MAKIVLPYKPREAFIPFHNRRARFAALVVHRRAGKTVSVINDLIIGALECPLERPQLAYIAPNYQQAKRVAWEYVKQYAAPLIHQVHESELRVTLNPNGAKIYLLGAEKADSLRGIYLDGAALDEYAQIRPSAVSQVILPALADRKGWAVFMGTPKGKNHFYDIIKKAANDPTWFHLNLKASQSGLLAKEELALIKSQMDASDYLQEFENSFDAALKGAIYGIEMETAQQENRIRPVELDRSLPLHCIVDLGYTDDTVLLFFQILPGGIVIHKIFSNNEQEWDYYLDEMDQMEITDLWVPHDARAKNLQTGRSIMEMCLKRGYRPQLIPDHKLRDGIMATRKLLPFCVWNEPLCSEGVEAMKSYHRFWDEKTGSYRDRPVHDWSSHIADTHRYLGVVFENLEFSRKKKSRIIIPGEPHPDIGRQLNYAFHMEDLWAHCAPPKEN